MPSSRRLKKSRSCFGAMALVLASLQWACKTASSSELAAQGQTPPLRTLTGHTAEITAAKGLPIGNASLYSTGWDGQVFLWNLDLGKSDWNVKFGGPIYDAIATPAGNMILVGGSNGLLRMLDAKTGRTLFLWDNPERGSVLKVAISPDSRRAAVAYLNGDLVFMDIQRGIKTKVIPNILEWPVVRLLKYSQDGLRLLVADAGSARDIDIERGVVLRTIRDPRYCNQSGCNPWLTAAALSDDRRLLAVGSVNEVRVFNMQSGLEFFTLGAHIAEVSQLEFRDASRQLVSQSLDGGLMAWAIPSTKLLTLYESISPAVWNFAADTQLKRLIGMDRRNYAIVISPLVDSAQTHKPFPHGSYQAQLSVTREPRYALRFGLIDNQWSDAKDLACSVTNGATGDPAMRYLICGNVAQIAYDTKTLLGKIRLVVTIPSTGKTSSIDLICSRSEASYATVDILNCKPPDMVGG